MNFAGSCSIQREKPAKARGGRRSAGFSVYLVVSDIIAFLENHVCEIQVSLALPD